MNIAYFLLFDLPFRKKGMDSFYLNVQNLGFSFLECLLISTHVPFIICAILKKKVLDLINRFHAFLSVEWLMYSYIGEIKRVICCTSRSYNAYATGQFVMAKSSSIRNFEVSLDIFTP